MLCIGHSPSVICTVQYCDMIWGCIKLSMQAWWTSSEPYISFDIQALPAQKLWSTDCISWSHLHHFLCMAIPFACQDPLLQGKSRESESVSNLPTGHEGSLMTPNKFWNMRRELRMIQTQKAEAWKQWEVLRHLESQGEFRRESHSSLRWGQTINIPKRSSTCFHILYSVTRWTQFAFSFPFPFPFPFPLHLHLQGPFATLSST